MTLEEAKENLKKAVEVLRETAEKDHLKRIEDAGDALMNTIRKNIELQYSLFKDEGDNAECFLDCLKSDENYAYEILTDGVLGNFIKYVEVICEE